MMAFSKNWYSTKINCLIQALPVIITSRDGFCHLHKDQDLGSVRYLIIHLFKIFLKRTKYKYELFLIQDLEAELLEQHCSARSESPRNQSVGWNVHTLLILPLLKPMTHPSNLYQKLEMGIWTPLKVCLN